MAGRVKELYRELVERAHTVTSAAQHEDSTVIQVGNATCENAAGSREVLHEFRKYIAASGKEDRIVLRETGCTGRCSCEPIVGVTRPGQTMVKYQKVDAEATHRIFTQHVLEGHPVPDLLLDAQMGTSPLKLLFCRSRRCADSMQGDYAEMCREKLADAGLDYVVDDIVSANCFGLCRSEMVGRLGHLMVLPDKVVYRLRNEADLDTIIAQHIQGGRIVDTLRIGDEPFSGRFFEMYGDVAFFNRQDRIALRHSGVIDPESLQEYIAEDGYQALAAVLERDDPAWVIEQVSRSRLRGRGGGGYPTGTKWDMARKAQADTKYIICNADEGDPGAFMDRSMLEGDPFSVLEGLTIGGYAIGARKGFFYIRAEYPLAIKRIQHAIDQARLNNLLGPDILGSGFDFDVEIRLGAGAFVCGEETALIHSIEGRRGEPRIRPPYPTESGLWGKPTVINNVETFANIAVVCDYGADWFANIGTAESGGTKVFALAGKVEHTGMVEVPMGMTLREIVFEIGGGVPDGKELKAVQTGGPAGGCLPAKWLDLPVDFRTLGEAGSIMGSGGMIVMDEDDCMVDIAKFFLVFSQDESCGKCTPCREGSRRMLEILERITGGTGTPQDLDNLERLAILMQKSSLCGLGRAAPNPVLSTLREFRDEYLAHVEEQRCPAHRCVALLRFQIDPEKCVGCTACARNCPVLCIQGKAKQVHEIDQSRCIKCGRCVEVCRFSAVDRL